MVDFSETPEEAAFRAELRAFVREHLPDQLRRQLRLCVFAPVPEELQEIQERWAAALRARRYHVAAWPKEYGGLGLSIWQQFIFAHEMAGQRAPMPLEIGTYNAGPTIILHGSEEQKRTHLPPIVSGDAVWCQGFSEPGAGSDLASLQTFAKREGDYYVLNGQKIWTSYAHLSDRMILLARTDREAPKHKGISFFLLDMRSPGVSVRPLYDMSGSHHFNEVFFEAVRIPVEDRVGEENRGWYIALSTLDIERSNTGQAVSQALNVEDIARMFAEQSLSEVVRAPLRFEIADRRIEAAAGQLLAYNVAAGQAAGGDVVREASTAKVYLSELEQRISDTAMRVFGLRGALISGRWAPPRGTIATDYLRNVAMTIGGGTSEINRNIIAQRGLGLPRG